MKAVLKGRVLAESEDVIVVGGYLYFPKSSVRTEWLSSSPKTADDLECPHGVRFYDVAFDGVRAERAAWSYEAPQPAMQATAGRIGFWNEVEVG